MRRAFLTALVAGLAAVATSGTPSAQSPGGSPSPAAIHVEPVQKNVYLLASAGSGNITAQIGSEGVLLVDSGIDRSAPSVVAALQKLSA